VAAAQESRRRAPWCRLVPCRLRAAAACRRRRGGEHDRQPSEQQQRPCETAVGPEVRLCDQRDERDRDQADAGQEPGPVAVAPERLGHDRVALALVRDHEPGGDVEQDARAADERQDRKADPEERRGDVEVLPKAAGDAGEDPLVLAAVQLLDRRTLGLGSAHCWSFLWERYEHALHDRGSTIGIPPESTLIFP
jgi:hypothetical protein